MLRYIENSICLTHSVLFCQRCSCGNCRRESLQNLSECYCCQELDGCTESMSSDQVMEDVPSDETLKCVTQHPGFNAVCLQKWSLRMAGERVRTKDKKKYTQTGSEDRWAISPCFFCCWCYDTRCFCLLLCQCAGCGQLIRQIRTSIHFSYSIIL